MGTENLYALDDTHPIPNMDVIDVNTVKKGGGSDLFIVVSAPLSDDERSLKRLLRKTERYLEFLHTDEFRCESGEASTKNTNIIIKIPASSAPAVFGLLERSKPWVADNGANLVIDTCSA